MAYAAEITRVCNLPRAKPITEAQALELSREVIQAAPFEGKCPCPSSTCRGRSRGKVVSKPLRLLPEQAAGLWAYRAEQCGFFSIRVGGGKTALSYLIAAEQFKRKPSSKILLLMPPQIIHQFKTQALPWARLHLSGWIPRFMVLGGLSLKKRQAMAKSALPGVYVVPYSLLSTEDGQELLASIDADLVIADEAQNLTGESARSDRFWAWVNRRKPEPPRGVAMSGTLTTKSPMDYHKLIRWCLRTNSPMPRPTIDALEWSAILQSGSDPSVEEVQRLNPLILWARRNFPGDKLVPGVPGLRTAFKLRLKSAPGVICSPDYALGTSLEIENLHPLTPMNAALSDLWDRVEQSGLSPNGDVLTYGIEKHECQRQLSAGFFIRRFWDESHPRVREAKKHWLAGQEYHKALRDFFRATRYPRPGLDTPRLVGRHHYQNGPIEGNEYLYDLWKEWKDLDTGDLPEQQSEIIRVCDYKIKLAVAWAQVFKASREGGILWVYHEGVGRWVYEALKDAGLPAMWKGAGEQWVENDGSEKFFCVASIASHHVGKNLQHHWNQIFVQWPRPANLCEQALGRCHRTGQKADRLIVNTVTGNDFDHEQIAATIQDTLYVSQTMDGAFKLLIADWNPPPRDYSAEYLRSRGYVLELD